MYKLLALILFSLSATLLQAQDLIDIYKLAVVQDAEFRIAESEYLASRESLPIASSLRKPQIDFGANLSQTELDGLVIDNTFQDIGYSINLTQTIYNAENRATIDAAGASVTQARAEFEVAQQDLILRVADRYFQILASQDVLEFARAEETAISRQLEQAQKRFEVGLIAITDVLEAQARYDSAQAQTILSENRLDNSLQAMEVIIGETPSTNPARLSDSLVLSRPVPAQSEPWVEIALQNNQSLLAALAAEKAANYERQIKNKSRYPTLDFTASYSDADIENDNNNSALDEERQEFSLGILFNVPLYTGGRISAERAQAEADYQSARSTALLQKRLTSQNTRIAYLGVISGISQVKALKQALKSSNTALEATEAGFDVGTRTSIDVLISLRATYASQRDYAGARYDYLINTLNLKQASGLLGTSDLEQINRWLVDELIVQNTAKPAGTENLPVGIVLSRIESTPFKADEPEELVVYNENQQLTRLQRDLDDGLHWLESEEKSRATIQIMMIGFRNFNAGDYYNYLDSLESQYIDVSGFRIYQTSINGTEVFGVIYGEYENRREASEQINKLPEVLKERSPMPRTIGGILNEINDG